MNSKTQSQNEINELPYLAGRARCCLESTNRLDPEADFIDGLSALRESRVNAAGEIRTLGETTRENVTRTSLQC